MVPGSMVADKADLGREVRRERERERTGAANVGRGGHAAKEREEGARFGARVLPPFLAGPLVFANCLEDVSRRHPSRLTTSQG